VILARRFGLKVVAMSMLTNLAAGMQGSSPSHDETKAVAAMGGAAMRRVVTNFIGRL
jgi:purine-nucleoside phosphorylase